MSSSVMKRDNYRNQRELRRRPTKRQEQTTHGDVNVYECSDLAKWGSVTRTKTLLLAALRVWELKRRIAD
jgi:hypothetical protein